MAINMSAWSIRHPLPPIVMAAAIVVLGCISFSKLPVTRMPNVDVPVISVTVAQFGAAPAELESRVTKIVEDAVAGVTGAHHINSVITDGITNTTILFRLETNTDRALNDVKDAVTSIRANLPPGIEEPLIQRVDIAGLPILTYAAVAPGKTPEQLSWFVDDVVIRALQGVRGVARVDRIGSVEREIRVGLDPVRLQSIGLTPLDVSRQLRGSNVDLAGGRAEIGGRDQAIRTLAGAKTVADLGATRIALPAGGELRLDDVGLITDTIAEPRTFAWFDGVPVVGFNILRAKGASDVTLAGAVAARIETIKAANPDVGLKLIGTSVTHTIGNCESAMDTLYEEAILAVIGAAGQIRDQGGVGDEPLPVGITVSEGGDAELQTELFDGFGGAMRSGLMMVYVVLAVLFTSVLQPVTILFSLSAVDSRRDPGVHLKTDFSGLPIAFHLTGGEARDSRKGLAREVKVVAELASADHQRGIFLADDRLADSVHRCAFPHRLA